MAQKPRHRPLQHQNRLQSRRNPLSLPPGTQKHAQRRADGPATPRLEHRDGLRSHPESDQMTPTTKFWIEKRLKMVNPARTLEIGSLNVNGAIERIGDYTGIDMRAGQNVDRVMNGHELEFEDESFNCVISAETLEHDDAPWKTAAEIYRVLEDKGVLLVTVP